MEIIVRLETDPEFSNRLKEDQKYLTKGTNRKALSRKPCSIGRTRRPSHRAFSEAQTKPDDSSDNPLDDYEMSKVMARKQRTGNKPQSNEVSLVRWLVSHHTHADLLSHLSTRLDIQVGESFVLSLMRLTVTRVELAFLLPSTMDCSSV